MITFVILKGRYTGMRCLHLKNVQYSKNHFVWDNFTYSPFIGELPKFYNA